MDRIIHIMHFLSSQVGSVEGNRFIVESSNRFIVEPLNQFDDLHSSTIQRVDILNNHPSPYRLKSVGVDKDDGTGLTVLGIGIVK